METVRMTRCERYGYLYISDCGVYILLQGHLLLPGDVAACLHWPKVHSLPWLVCLLITQIYRHSYIRSFQLPPSSALRSAEELLCNDGLVFERFELRQEFQLGLLQADFLKRRPELIS